jgi:hypothetical protein
MSAVGIGLAWAFITSAAFVALSASALARTRHELEVDPRSLHTNTQWPVIEVSPTNTVLRSSPSVVRMQAGTSRREGILLS